MAHGHSATMHRPEWFKHFLGEQILPQLEKAAERATQHGAAASCREVERDDGIAAELTITPSGLPVRARPPRLTISMAHAGDRPLSIDITGTFPRAGVGGSFGAEVEYDSIYPDQLDDQIMQFVAMATGQ